MKNVQKRGLKHDFKMSGCCIYILTTEDIKIYVQEITQASNPNMFLATN